MSTKNSVVTNCFDAVKKYINYLTNIKLFSIIIIIIYDMNINDIIAVTHDIA